MKMQSSAPTSYTKCNISINSVFNIQAIVQTLTFGKNA